MNKEIKIGGRKIVVKIKSFKKSKRLRIIINSRGELVITKPFWLSQKKAWSFLEDKKDWILSTYNEMRIDPISVLKNEEKEKENYKLYKSKAREIIKSRVDYINNKYYGFSYNNIYIRNQKTRWGSCSKKNNLNFSYRLIFLDKEALDYIVAHELCHLKEFNHSKSFWSLVEKASPNYIYWRKKLKNYEPDLISKNG